MALEIVQILAAGTFGHVAVTRDTVSGRLSAAKILKEEHLENEKLIRRIYDEAAILGRLNHPNIVHVSGVREILGRPLVLLEWVKGAPLDALLSRCPEGLPPGDACEIIRITTAALAAAHEAPDPYTGEPLCIIHRDFKPSNVLMSTEGVVKVLDFGIAKAEFVGKQSETITMVLGAHGYLAPERLDGADDHLAGDIYAIGCSLYELLAARRMRLSLHEPTHAERIQKELMRLRPVGANPRTLGELAELLEAMCAYRPASRPTHAQVIDGLTRLMMGAGWMPNLPLLAQRHVAPLLEEGALTSPKLHPAYPDLRFIETSSGGTPIGAMPRESDDNLRRFLANGRWYRKGAELKRMLAHDPSWTPAPFLEVLAKLASGRIWRRWRNDEDARDQLVVALGLLAARPTREVVQIAKSLVRYGDPEVETLARQLSRTKVA